MQSIFFCSGVEFHTSAGEYLKDSQVTKMYAKCRNAGDRVLFHGRQVAGPVSRFLFGISLWRS